MVSVSTVRLVVERREQYRNPQPLSIAPVAAGWESVLSTPGIDFLPPSPQLISYGFSIRAFMDVV
jgi:hypothetical protein